MGTKCGVWMIVDGFGAVAGVASHVELGCGYGGSMRGRCGTCVLGNGDRIKARS
jgi:hypothetical protein